VEQGRLCLTSHVTGADQPPVPQHGHLIGKLEHFAEKMRDQHDGRAARGQPPDDLMQPDHVGPGQGRRRLVHDDQLGVPAKGPQDLDLLLIRGPQAPGACLAAEVKSGRRSQLVEPAPQCPPAHEPRGARFRAKEHVLGDGQRRDHR
jgi:hypothetical protein